MAADTYAAVYYLAGDDYWYPVAQGYDVDVATLIYKAPTYVFVWWWDGTKWTSEVVYGNGMTGGTLKGTPLARAPVGIGSVAGTATSAGVIALEVALAAGALYGFYLLVKRR